MSEKRFTLELPDNVSSQLKLIDQESVKLELSRDTMVLTTQASDVSLFQRISWWWIVLPALLSSIAFNVYFAVKKNKIKFP